MSLRVKLLTIVLICLSLSSCGGGGGGGTPASTPPPANPDGYTVTKLYTFDDPMNFGDGLVADTNGSSIIREIRSDPSGTPGNYCTYHEINYDGGATYRSETDSRNTHLISSTSDEWYGIRIFIPEGYAVDPIQEVVIQWRGREDDLNEHNLKRHPPLAIRIKNGNWVVKYFWDSDAESTNPDGMGNATITLGPVASDQNRWTVWKLHVGWNYNGSGYLYIWKDDVLVVNRTYISIGYNDNHGPYCKFGEYKSDWQTVYTPGVTTRGIYHDDFWYGVSK